jgi:Calx-beta domain
MSAALALRTTVIAGYLLGITACGGSGSSASPGSTANDTTGTNSIAMSAAAYSGQQTSGSIAVSVARTGTAINATSVKYSTSNGSATAGTDYTATSGSLTWSDGDTTSKTITIPVSSTPFSGSKTFAVALSDAGSGASIGTPGTATVTISGSGSGSGTGTPPAAGSLQLSATSYSVAQSIGTVSVSVNRVGGSSGAVKVSYATTNGSAAAGTDFTASSGQLSWASGDTAAKSVSIAVNATSAFVGSKAFSVALSAPSGGASLGTPSSATVAITGSGSPTPGTGAPSAVGNLQLINQGGPSNTATNIQQMSWTAATAGGSPISYYKIYRNGVSYDKTTALTYTDKSATNSNDPTWATPATTYSYDVTAVDAAGNEGPKAGRYTVYAYQNGKSNWNNSGLSYGNLVENYASTAGNPQGGTYDVSVNFTNGGFQPAVHPPQAPEWDLEVGAFNYYIIDVNPGPVVNGTALPLGTVSRLPPGDVYGWHPTVNIYDYGPAPVANKWATYKVPMLVLGMGTCEFTGSISGNTLTVTAIVTGDPLVDAGGFVTGQGVPAGTYITAYAQHGAIGTFTIGGPGISSGTRVASTKMSYQRTSLYKFGIQPTIQNVTMYFNNMGFSTN